MRGLALQCRAAKIPCHITLLDNDRRILDQTKAACEAFPEISVRPGTVWELNRLGRFDYVFCNHFLHHFSDSEIPNVLRTMYDAANGTLIVNDLRRSFFAYAAFTLFAGLFLHQSFAAYDGRLSIRKGFLEKELEAFAQSAGLEACAKITRLAPSRMLLIAVRPRPAIHSKQEMSQ
jgi:2-polyprenyl-3-methyl-5-hydroxy-6-metoxy-1,4-benzoquinol methylase